MKRGLTFTALLLGAALGVASAASVKLQPQGDSLTRAVQAALSAISTKELPVTLDSSSGTILTLGGAGTSAALFNPDVAARVVTVGGARRIEFNPAGPLPLLDAVKQELARELGFKDWTAEAARTRLSGADLNGDGRIDLTDLAILMENYGKSSSVGDLNQDRKVDDADLRIFSAQYKATPTPEPKSEEKKTEQKPAEMPGTPATPAVPGTGTTPPTTTPAAPTPAIPPTTPPAETTPKEAAPGTAPRPVPPSPAPPADPAPKQP
ncbi:hypothetical protein [Deinococcus marmoris]|uniref:EF-hand domain-containing protein n=1 Tax=Deinococcus marmoris TaxID=249408 RepID=A0A1U7NWW2_9DEIO|nr:hypothetical protein [Deinococcus marmoris]OLV17413.1 hypothetical protein BOO71_0008974 [Deinococcus marmoris]